jgi:hypothetical protein
MSNPGEAPGCEIHLHPSRQDTAMDGVFFREVDKLIPGEHGNHGATKERLARSLPPSQKSSCWKQPGDGRSGRKSERKWTGLTGFFRINRMLCQWRILLILKNPVNPVHFINDPGGFVVTIPELFTGRKSFQ